MRIEKKITPEFFQKVASGEKNFEVRLADFKCAPGDVLVLKEYDPQTKRYTGRSVERTVTYVLKMRDAEKRKFYSKEQIEKFGLQIISFRPN